MANDDNQTTATPAKAQKSKTGLLIIGALVIAALAAVIYLFSSDTPEVADAAKPAASDAQDAAAPAATPKASPELASLLEEGALEDIVLGDPNAETVIVEYASMTCPHCAHFYTEVFPELQKKYIDTGKARFIFREFPIDSLAAAASMLARCAGKDRFYPMIDGLFETQESWAVPGPDGKEKLKLIAKQAGFSSDAFEKCIADKDLFANIVAVRKKALEDYGVDATPTFFVNGKKLSGVTIDVFDAAIEGKPEAGKPDGDAPETPSGN